MFKKVKERISMLRTDMEDTEKKSMPDSFLVIWVWRLGHSVYQPLVSWLLENWLWRTDQEPYFRREIDSGANTFFWMEVAQLGNHRPPSSCWGNSLGVVRAVWVLSLCKLPPRIRSGEGEWTLWACRSRTAKTKRLVAQWHLFHPTEKLGPVGGRLCWVGGSGEIFLIGTLPRERCALKECKAGDGERSCPHTPRKFLVRHYVEDPSLGVTWPLFLSLSQSNGLAFLTFCSFLFSLLASILLACVLSRFSCVQLFQPYGL